jgi:hypothetical protein
VRSLALRAPATIATILNALSPFSSPSGLSVAANAQSEKSMISLPRQSFGSMPSFARAFSFSFRSCLDSTHPQPAYLVDVLKI